MASIIIHYSSELTVCGSIESWSKSVPGERFFRGFFRYLHAADGFCLLAIPIEAPKRSVFGKQEPTAQAVGRKRSNVQNSIANGGNDCSTGRAAEKSRCAPNLRLTTRSNQISYFGCRELEAFLANSRCVDGKSAFTCISTGLANEFRPECRADEPLYVLEPWLPTCL